jgi:mannose-6-phosphate isomerase
MALSPGVFQLKGVVQPYSWGGHDYIPQLLGHANETKTPAAEYWMGAHPNHPSTLPEKNGITLVQLIEEAPKDVLGETVEIQYGSLPYLLKVLDVRQMLSIQVHPDKASAEKGYEEEDKKNIDLKRADRNYKDRNHKPEMAVALGDFWLLHGFKNEEALDKILHDVPEFAELLPFWESGSYRGLYELVMQLPQHEVDRILAPLVERVSPLYEQELLQKTSEDFWAARAVQSFCRNGQLDRGIFSIYFFNVLHLHDGEGIYQPAGLPHAYLEGQNVEIMANSDNVLRAGLTDKHIDVPELMKHVRFEATNPQVIRPAEGMHQVFPSAAREFELHRYRLAAGEKATVDTATAELFLVLEGSVELRSAEGALTLLKGGVALALANRQIELVAEEAADVFRVTVPR